jgi:hypothetical protein
MLALTLTLTVLGGPSTPPTPDLRLVPRLEVEQPTLPAPPAAASPAPGLELSAPELPPERLHDRGRVLRASGGVLAGDAIGAALLTVGLVTVVSDVWGGGSSGDAGAALLLAGTGVVLFLPPKLAVSFAARPDAPPAARTRAYWKAFGARLAAMLVASAIGRSEGARPLGVAVFAASELALVPWVVVSTLDGGG